MKAEQPGRLDKDKEKHLKKGIGKLAEEKAEKQNRQKRLGTRLPLTARQ
jgi:hypothetical protein